LFSAACNRFRHDPMTRQFLIRDWSGFAPGLEDRQAWLDWAAHPHLPEGDAAPTLSEMPPMQRRRVEKLGRMALQVAFWCQSAADAGWPLVFASRHGDLARTYAMLQELARGNALSPTHFGLSTHNAIAAQYSIARALPANYLAVSAGACSAEAALVEAQGLLADGASDVLVVNYDSAVPEDYRVFADEPGCDFAWAWRVSLGEANASGTGEGFSLTAVDIEGVSNANEANAPRELPHGLDVMRFMLSGDQSLAFSDGERSWLWQRHV
jgi:hypothetical protein